MEELWWKYKEEGLTKNLSLQAFYSILQVPYNAFEKYLKLRCHFSDVHQVTVTDIPESNPMSLGKVEKQPQASCFRCERAVGPYSLSQKTSPHCSSHRGAKVRAILRSFVGPCKLDGIGVINYFTSFFEAVCGERPDYENLLPATIVVKA